MKEFVFGTKNYDIDWFLKYGLSYNEAVKTLREWGFSCFLAQNCYLQMVGSAVVRQDCVDRQVEAILNVADKLEPDENFLSY